MQEKVAKAKSTGRVIDHPKGNLHEVRCQNCGMEQYHPHGIHRCISCDSRFKVVWLEVVRPEGKESLSALPVIPPDNPQ